MASDSFTRMSLYEELRTRSVSVQMRQQLTGYQELVYNSLLKVNPGSFIAGKYAAYNLKWSKEAGTVNFYLPIATESQLFKATARQNIMELYEETCLLEPSLQSETVIHDFTVSEDHNNDEEILISVSSLDLNIHLFRIPQYPIELSLIEKRIYGMIYGVSKFKHMFARVAIVDYYPQRSEFIVFGYYQSALNEINLKLYTIRHCQSQLEQLMKRKVSRHRRTDLGTWRYYQRILLEAYTETLEYLPSADMAIIDYVPKTWMSIYLPYGLNPNLKRVLPTCLQFLEKEVKLTSVKLEIVMDYQMSINFPGGDELIELENLSALPKDRKCIKCRYKFV